MRQQEAPTQDPAVVIEASGPGLVRYRNTTTGRRWEVRGICDGRGWCMIGSVIDVDGEPVQIRDQAHLGQLRTRLGYHLGFTADSPVTPEFGGSCCPFTYAELPPGA